MTEKQQKEIEKMENLGMEIVKLFDLKPDKSKRYNTTWGTKTLLGLGRAVHNITKPLI